MNDEKSNMTPSGPPTDDTSRPLNGYIEVLFGPLAGKQFNLAKDTVVIGRGDDADIVLDDPTMSRRHAAIRRLPDGFHLTDLGGSNGTLANGKVVTEIVLEDGMTVETGTTVLAFRSGVAQKAAKTDDTLRLRTTQKLPALGTAAESSTPGRTATQPGMKVQSRRGVPPASLAQLVSWVVILALVAGGILLGLALLDYSSPPQVESKDLAEATARQARATRQRLPSTEEGGLSVAAAPDVAQERLRVAVELETTGDLAGALKVYEEINTRYPEFLPPAGQTVPERVDSLKKKIQFGELVTRAQAVLDDPQATPKALQETGDELGLIPTSDKEFGEKAHQLTESLRLRLKELEAQEAQDRLRKVEGEAVGPGTEAPPVPPASTPAPSGETPTSAAEQARSKAKSLYKNGEFDEAVAVLRAAATGSEGESLGRLAGRIEAFGKTYREAVSTARAGGLEEDALDLIEKARALDGDLYGSYRSELDDLVATTSVAQAQRRLTDGDFAAARRMLDTARKYRSANKEVSKLESLFAFKAAQLVKQAREASDPAAAIELADQAILLAGPDSSAGGEAAQLKKKLTE